jgi:agmatinase
MDIGQGHGIAGRFGGLPDPYGTEEFAKIVLLPVPFDLTTTYQKGTNHGPTALIEASRNLELYDIETDSEVYLKGIFTAPPVIEKSSEAMLKTLYQRTKTLLDHEKFVVTVGGEHSLSYAPIKAHAEKYQKITVLQLDAHADLQNAYEGNPFSHASIMARLQEHEGVEKIVSVGIRSMSSQELLKLDRQNTFFSHQIFENPLWIDQALEKLTGFIYITFDLDVFDSSLMPSTGTPEPGGLQWNETLQFLKRVFKEKSVVGFDVVELCPNSANKAPDYLAAKLIYKLLSYKYFS